MLCKRPKRQHPHIFCFLKHGVNQIFVWENTSRRTTFFIETETWRQMLHLMSNINFTSDMIAGSGWVTGPNRGQVQGRDLEILCWVLKCTRNFCPPRKKNNIGKYWKDIMKYWHTDAIKIFWPKPIFPLLLQQKTVPFCFFSLSSLHLPG